MWKADGTNITTPQMIEARAAEDAVHTRRRTNAEARSLRAQLLAATNEQIDTYVDANATNLAGVRTMMKRILKLIAADMKQGD